MAKLGEVFNKAGKEQKEEHPKWITTWIHYSKLRRNKKQYCDATDTEEIEHLADLISAYGGVMQNLIVRKWNADEYEIIAGHKRTQACKYLTEERHLEGFEFLPCIVTNKSEAKTRLAIVSSNAHHEKTHYEIMYEMKELEYLFTHYPEEFSDEELKGRMVERIGRKMGKSRSVVTDYISIANNLGDEGMEEFKKGNLNKDAALTLSSFTENEQSELLKKGVTKGKDLRKYKKEKAIKNSETVKTTENVDVNKEEVDTFLSNYKNWDVWTKNPLTEETFYCFVLPDDVSIVVKSYLSSLESRKESEKVEYYLLKENYKHFNDCRLDKASLKAYLHEIPKT